MPAPKSKQEEPATPGTTAPDSAGDKIGVFVGKGVTHVSYPDGTQYKVDPQTGKIVEAARA